MENAQVLLRELAMFPAPFLPPLDPTNREPDACSIGMIPAQMLPPLDIPDGMLRSALFFILKTRRDPSVSIKLRLHPSTYKELVSMVQQEGWFVSGTERYSLVENKIKIDSMKLDHPAVKSVGFCAVLRCAIENQRQETLYRVVVELADGTGMITDYPQHGDPRPTYNESAVTLHPQLRIYRL